MRSTPALVKWEFLAGRWMDHSHRGQVHQGKSPFTTISSALPSSSSPHCMCSEGRMSEPAQTRGTKLGGDSEIWDWIRVMKWRHFPAAWLSYNIKATITKCSNTVGLYASVPQLFSQGLNLEMASFFVLLLYWSILVKKKKKKYGQKWWFTTKMVRLQKITNNIINKYSECQTDPTRIDVAW